MGFFDFLKPKDPIIGGGIGTEESPIIINAKNSFAGIDAEYAYLEKRFGQKDKDWKLTLQMSGGKDRQWDALTIETNDGRQETIYFDITKFYGKFF